MAEITAAMVKEMRTKTGAGMMDCKKALTECDGSVEKAVDWLRKKGLAAAAKKADRVAAEGLIATAQDGGRGILVELNAETDFVARNDQFQDLARTIAQVAQEVGTDLDMLNAAAYPGTGRTVAEELTNAIARVGENMNLRRAAGVSASPGVVASYMHNAVAPGLGKIGVVVALQSDGDSDKLAAFGKQIAMHVAASNPSSVSVEELDASAVDRERAILSDQARASGKPENIIEKMVEGRLRKYYQEVVLLEQTFVIDSENTVRKALEIAAEDIGGAVEIVGFERFALGEGIERQKSDFAADVAASAAG